MLSIAKGTGRVWYDRLTSFEAICRNGFLFRLRWCKYCEIWPWFEKNVTSCTMGWKPCFHWTSSWGWRVSNVVDSAGRASTKRDQNGRRKIAALDARVLGRGYGFLFCGRPRFFKSNAFFNARHINMNFVWHFLFFCLLPKTWGCGPRSRGFLCWALPRGLRPPRGWNNWELVLGECNWILECILRKKTVFGWVLK